MSSIARHGLLLVKAAIAGLVLLLIAGTVAARAAKPAFTSVPGALALWSLDEGSGITVADDSGGGADGLLTGDATWMPGDGPALSFDGDGAVAVPAEAQLQPVAAVSVAAWVRGSSSPGPYAYIAAKGAAGCVAASYGLYTGAKGGLEFYVAGMNAAGYIDSPDAGRGVWDGRWHLVVGTYDGTAVRLYVDGAQIGSGDPHTGPLQYALPSSNEFVIGNYPPHKPGPGCQSYGFTGEVGEVGVWGSGLTAAQIAALGGGSTSPIGPGPGTGGGGSSGGGSGTGTSGGGTGTGGSGGGTGTGDPGATFSLPVLSHLRLHLHGRSRTHGTRHPARWMTIDASYWASESSRTTLTLQVRHVGRVIGTRCIAGARATRARGAGARCSWWATVRRTTHHDRPHRNRVVMRLRPRGLSAGRYRFLATPSFDGRWGLTRQAALTVTRWRLG